MSLYVVVRPRCALPSRANVPFHGTYSIRHPLLSFHSFYSYNYHFHCHSYSSIIIISSTTFATVKITVMSLCIRISECLVFILAKAVFSVTHLITLEARHGSGEYTPIAGTTLLTAPYPCCWCCWIRLPLQCVGQAMAHLLTYVNH